MKEYISIPISKNKLRALCHRIFDCLWKYEFMSRSESYFWLAEQIQVFDDKIHFTKMKRTKMIKTVYVCVDYLNNRYKEHDEPFFIIISCNNNVTKLH